MGFRNGEIRMLHVYYLSKVFFFKGLNNKTTITKYNNNKSPQEAQ